jgi:uncharacterized membrane-anchored protein YitT (DUF2179 family)
MPASNSARLFICLVVFSGFSLFADAMVHASSENRLRFISFLVVAVVAARLRVKLPGVTGTMSVNLPFILLAAARMGMAEAMVVGCLSTFSQCLPRAGKRFNWVQAIFNVANMALVVRATCALYTSTALASAINSRPLLLAVAAAGFFAVNTVPVSIIIALTENKNVLQAWLAMFQLSFPYFLASAGVAGVALTVSAGFGWQVPLLMLPLMLLMFYSYRRYFSMSSAFAAEARRAPQSVIAGRAVS